MARESNSRLKLGDFGTFVIFAAIYVAGTLGLPTISLPAYQVKILEMASPFVALFGMPALLGLTLGQFIANLSLQARPISMLSPIFSFVGLLAIYYMRKRSTLAGSLAYIVITGLWLSLTLPIAKLGVSSSLATLSAFAGQFVALMVGYVVYLLMTKTMTTASDQQKQVSATTQINADKSLAQSARGVRRPPQACAETTSCSSLSTDIRQYARRHVLPTRT